MILILDFGSQYTQLIARRIREIGVYSEIHPYHKVKEIDSSKIEGLILSGGPGNVYAKDAFLISREDVERFNVPVLGICYGMQLLTHLYNGKVIPGEKKEYGFTNIKIRKSKIFKGLKKNQVVWMSHGDRIDDLGIFKVIAESDSAIAAIENAERNIYALQFHPEVVHTENGKKIIENFVFGICKAEKNWERKSFIEHSIQSIRQGVGNKSVVLGLSGGVDSSTLALLLNRAIGKQITCVFVNNGLLRKNEVEEVVNTFSKYDLNFKYIDAENIFLERLNGVVDPEEKRKIIGKTFIEVFNREAKGFDFLAQGTLYPDVIESVSVKGPSDTIKTHHNRAKEVLDLIKENKVIEPFKELFKDEVREIAKDLGLPKDIIERQPFPGPGLAIRIIGEVTRERLKILRDADHIVVEEMKKSGWYNKVWQSFAVLLPVKSVGVMGDKRTYENVIAVRIVNSVDGMTADWSKIPYEILNTISNRIINEVKGVNRVVYDISSKPPATIEWE